MLIEGSYEGAEVFVTGTSGFLGSVVLEQLLRLTKVSRVFVLLRGNKRKSAHQRLQDLLCSPLFNLLHEQVAAGSHVLKKVVVVEGDLALPGMGLSGPDRQLLASHTSIILHCAALVELDACVHKTFSVNYLGTKQLMGLATEMPLLNAFVFTSTYYVNNFLPHNAVVEERIHTLDIRLDGSRFSPEEFVAAMLSLSPAEATLKTAAVMKQLEFGSTYAFGKFLTEVMFSGCSIRPGVRRAIVRPSLISAIAGKPLPGFITGFAGSGGYCIGYGAKFFQGPGSVAYQGNSFLDLIPADCVASLVIAAAAAGGGAGPGMGKGTQAAAADEPAVIYHATSSGSHPLPICLGFDILHQFWSLNPAPISLPFSRLVRVDSRTHKPTTKSIESGHRRAQLKLKLLELPLRLAGQHKLVRLLQNSLKAFRVQNAQPYAKSMVCSVDNARELQRQLDPEEKKVWRLVWEPTIMGWEEWSWTFLAGVRQLLLKMDDDVKGPHSFVKLPAVSPESLRLPALGTAKPLEQGLQVPNCSHLPGHASGCQRCWATADIALGGSSSGSSNGSSNGSYPLQSGDEKGKAGGVVCVTAAANQSADSF